ncbi:MAG: hypothetical protein HYZ51_01150 [Candidatus Doudnabacteria bacterium]|nr:hypothetical protein [Candidatus Doudnabacteria bacterium]
MEIRKHTFRPDVPPPMPPADNRRIEEIKPNETLEEASRRAFAEFQRQKREAGERINPAEPSARGQNRQDNRKQSEAETQAEMEKIRKRIQGLPLAG